jgi:hypothetical protein
VRERRRARQVCGREREQRGALCARSHPPAPSLPARPPPPRSYLGGPGSGAPWHLHKDAVNALVYGRKLWLLLPPERALYSALPMAEWLAAAEARGSAEASTNATSPATTAAARGLPKGALVCVQRAGDVMYVPPGWGHAVLNLNTSVGVAIEMGTVFG